jgi:hypothetical protein
MSHETSDDTPDAIAALARAAEAKLATDLPCSGRVALVTGITGQVCSTMDECKNDRWGLDFLLTLARTDPTLPSCSSRRVTRFEFAMPPRVPVSLSPIGLHVTLID